MKTFVILSIFFTLTSVKCIHESMTDKAKILSSYWSQYQTTLNSTKPEFEKLCPGAFDKLDDASKEVKKCYEDIDFSSLTLCETFHTYFVTCSQPLVDIWSNCKETQIKSFSTLALRSVSNVVDYFCNQRGELILELVNPCIYKELTKTNDKIEECNDIVKSTTKKYEKTVPTQSEFCTVATTFRSCIQTRVTMTCKNVKTRQAVIELYDALVSPCNNINEI